MKETINHIFNQFSSLHILVVGDVMLDTYCWGNVHRISPEAPVPIVNLVKEENRVGGAANVALNLASLGVNTYMASVCGQDNESVVLTQLLAQQHINTDALIQFPDRKTTRKTRIMSRNQQLMRLDYEQQDEITPTQAKKLYEAIENLVVQKKINAIIFEDYNKGVLTQDLITQLINLSKQHQVLTMVDPKKQNFFAYKGVHIFKPNLKEVTEALFVNNVQISENGLNQIHQQLHQQLQHQYSLITLSEKGVYYGGQQQHHILPCFVRNIADVSGAGDTVIAVASSVFAITQDIHLAAAMGNLAGGLVCEEVGTAPINQTRLKQECYIHLI